MVDLTLKLTGKTKKEIETASWFLDRSLTLKYQFRLIRKRDYTQRDGLFGQTRFYESNFGDK
jgi:hypothetical protein